MLGKLLKHEFRATGRLMLPALGAVLALAVLANFSISFIQVTDSTFLAVLLGLVIATFVIGMIAVTVMTTVVMVLRFYRNLLRDEGYLMHTLPVSVHGLVCSKLIVSLCWFVVTFLVILLTMLLTGLIQSGTNLGEFFAGFPSWAEIKEALDEVGIRSGDLWLLGSEYLLILIFAGLATCLHFYAAMALGQMFSKNKILLSILFFVGLNIVFSIFGAGYGTTLTLRMEDMFENLETGRQMVQFVQHFFTQGLIVSALQTAVMYVITTWCLQKKLNLA